jgi:uncharacterized protein
MATSRDSNGMRLLGLATGLVFGALLQRGRLARYDVIVGQLLFEDARVLKTVASAIAVGTIGIHVLERKGLTQKKSIKPMKVGGVVAGAALFGAGLALLGYCPGTSVAAVGEGHRDALAGVLGMLAGAGAFVALHPRLVPLLDAGGDLGKATLPSVTATRATPWVIGLAGAAAGAAALAGSE